MYFTENKELQRFEREMKIVPNFERKEVWEYADSCNECKNYKCKLEGCMEAHCPYLMRKIRSNSIITRDLVETFLLDHPYIPFAHRVIDMLAKYKGNKLFYNKAHKAAFEAAMSEFNDDDYDHIVPLGTGANGSFIQRHSTRVPGGYISRRTIACLRSLSYSFILFPFRTVRFYKISPNANPNSAFSRACCFGSKISRSCARYSISVTLSR